MVNLIIASLGRGSQKRVEGENEYILPCMSNNYNSLGRANVLFLLWFKNVNTGRRGCTDAKHLKRCY